jgi:hypothetical protein
MKAYVILREEWDDSARTQNNSVYCVFTDKDRAIETVNELNKSECDCEHSSYGVIYHLYEYDTDVVGEVYNPII